MSTTAEAVLALVPALRRAAGRPVTARDVDRFIREALFRRAWGDDEITAELRSLDRNSIFFFLDGWEALGALRAVDGGYELTKDGEKTVRALRVEHPELVLLDVELAAA